LAGFTTVAEVKVALSIPALDTTHDARLAIIVAAVCANMLAIFQLTTTAATAYTSKFDVLDGGTEGIWLPQYPVISVDTVTINGTALTSDDFYLARPAIFGCLSRIAGWWPISRQKIEVTHTAGWATVPDDLKQAAILWSMLSFNTGAKTGYDSEKIGQYGYKLGAAAGGGGGGEGAITEPPEVTRMLSSWRRVFVPGS
jgi:hypothetical protein